LDMGSKYDQLLRTRGLPEAVRPDGAMEGVADGIIENDEAEVVDGTPTGTG